MLPRLLVALAAVAALGGLVATGTFSAPRAAAPASVRGKAPAARPRPAARPKPKHRPCARVAKRVRRTPLRKTKKPKKARPCPRRAAPPSPPARPPSGGPAPTPAPPRAAAPPSSPPLVQPVAIWDDAAGAALFSLSAMAPGRTVERCVAVRYGGAGPAQVRWSATGSAGGLGGLLDIAIDPGTASGPGCAGFVAGGVGAWSGTLDALLAAHDSWATGMTAASVAGGRWGPGDRMVFRIRATLRDDPSANGGALGPLAAGPVTFTWEARDG